MTDIMAEDEVTEEEIVPVPRKRGRPKGSKNGSRTKTTPKEEGVDVPPFTLEDVAAFATERQLIWHRRFIDQMMEPWTEDETLRHWRICNIVRELDAGTIFANKIQTDFSADDTVRVFNACLYRLLNRSDVWTKYVGWTTPSAEMIDKIFDGLEAASAEGESTGTSAWRASGLKVQRRQAHAVLQHLDELTLICRHSQHLSTVHAVLTRTCEIGDFTAYQVALDLKMLFPNLDNSDWAHVYGKGSARNGGSAWAFGQLAEPGETTIETAKRLERDQHDWLPPAFFDALPPFLRMESGGYAGKIRLEDVDNIMCEFRKYWLKKHGIGILARFGSGPEPAKRGSLSRRGGGRGTRRSESENWSTPPALFAQLNEEFGFTVDAAAATDNHVMDRFWTPDDDAFSQTWEDEAVYAFPPFSELRDWTAKAVDEVLASTNCQVVMLVPAYVETKWWYENVVQHAHAVRFVRGMVQFHQDGAPRSNVFQSGVAVVEWNKLAPIENAVSPITQFGLTYPDRPTVPKSGWTGGV